jgi:hypothetical protein
VMLAVLTEPVDVRLIEDNDWFDPFLVPLAIILAGLIAGGLAWLVHRQSLEAEDRRLKGTFRHERRMRNRDAARAALDEVVSLISRTLETTTDFTGAIVILEGIKAEFDEARSRETSDSEWHSLGLRLTDAHEKVSKATMPAHHATAEGLYARFKLQLWFGGDHPIVQTFARWQEAIRRWFDLVHEGAVEPRSAKALEESEAQLKESSEALKDFLDAARGWSLDFDSDDDG